MKAESKTITTGKTALIFKGTTATDGADAALFKIEAAKILAAEGVK
ncbi:hypothetical protein COO91_09112 (plasmid) [Nostoc flagelliforme CCNUN1]|uniref:Uncharacterized protein n=1 Tax=Nostoc flagelliforme CCNUN1 TaxID=2038116 RepID=A0A2K8T5F9_9NOSO|nr:hypothetical protein COO91_09112 [Nostoc flagelliforme CCNUN1]